MDAAAMRAQVRKELEHIPNWPEPQNQLRMSYWLMRMHSLGKKARSRGEQQSARDVLQECVAMVCQSNPGAAVTYDQAFFATAL